MIADTKAQLSDIKLDLKLIQFMKYEILKNFNYAKTYEPDTLEKGDEENGDDVAMEDGEGEKTIEEN